MANLTSSQIKDSYQSVLTTSETTSDPTTGTLQNGKGSAITSLTVSGALALTGDLTVDTSTLKVDSANNRVGIGTATPATKLHVKSGGYGEVARFHDPADSGISLIANASAGFNEFASSGNLPLLIAVNGSERARIDSSGNVGIGVAPSAWVAGYKVLQVGNASWYTDNNANTNFAANTYQASGFVDTYISSNEAAKYEQFDGAHKWFNAPSGTAGAAITFTQAMTLDASGNLGVGETSPGQRLVVKNTSAAPYVSIIAGDSSVMGILMGKASNTVDGQILYSNSTQVMQFVTASSESARIDSSGNVGIGTTNPSTKLDVSTLNSSYTEPIMQYNGTCRVFAGRITKAQGNTHTITIPFQSQSSQYSGAVVEVLFTASWTDAGATFAGRAIYALTTLNAMTNLAEIQDIGSGVSFAGAISGMNLIITATTTASAGQEPNRIGAYVKVVTSNPSVSASPTTMTLA